MGPRLPDRYLHELCCALRRPYRFRVLTLNTTYADQARLAVESNLSGALPFATPLEMWVYEVPYTNPVGSPYPFRADELDVRHQLHQVHVEPSDRALRDHPQGAWPAASMVVCGVPPDQFDSVGVYLKVRHNFVTNFFGASKVIAEHTIMRLEPQPADSCAAVGS